MSAAFSASWKVRISLLLIFIGTLSIGNTVQSAERRVEIPFQLREGLLWVEVICEGSREPLEFIFDTGASVSVVNLDLCRKLKWRLPASVPVGGIGGAGEGAWPVRFDGRLAGPGSCPLPTKLLGLDLTELSEATGSRVDGLIGGDFIKDHVVRIDFAKRLITMQKPGSFEPPLQAETIPLKRRGGAWLVPLRVNGGDSEWFRLDTGCSGNLHWVNGKASRKNGEAVVAAGIGEVKLTSLMVDAQFGESEFSGVQAMIHARTIFPGEAGLLGTGLLTNYSVTIDPKSSRLYLEKSSPARLLARQ